MKTLLLVGFGGCIGAIARYKLGGVFLHHSLSWKLPLSTILVNLTGCFITGSIMGLIEKFAFFDKDWRVFLFTGLLGGFTTFSAFGLETIYLLEKNEIFMAATNVLVSVIIGLLMLYAAMKIFSW